MSMCCIRLSALPKECSHSAHLCSFSPEWVIMCFRKISAWPNDFLHSEQVWVFNPLWVGMCLFRYLARPNYLLHCTEMCVLVFSDVLPDQMTSYILSNCASFLYYASPICFETSWIWNFGNFGLKGFICHDVLNKLVKIFFTVCIIHTVKKTLCNASVPCLSDDTHVFRL